MLKGSLHKQSGQDPNRAAALFIVTTQVYRTRHRARRRYRARRASAFAAQTVAFVTIANCNTPAM